MLETLEEADVQDEGREGVLIYVLDYDDLLAADTVALPLGRTRPISIGRAADAEKAGFRAPGELRIPDRWMSGEHAVLDRSGAADVIRDAGSRNGTRVNGRRVTEQRLSDGDAVEVGHSLLVYRELRPSQIELLQQPESMRHLGPTASYCAEVVALAHDLARIGPSNEPVLVLAETGAGKELVAQTVHALSGRSGAFRPVDCGAVPENLFESTFFGHRKGAFTGADEPRVGEISGAHRGTLFLDEVGNMSEPSQAKLLRVMETGEVTPVGATASSTVDVRWIAATNRDLFDTAGASGFRQDLLRRLAGYVARLPPLRERREDLGVLTAYLLRDAGATSASMTVTAARALFGGELPGNIRQLRATLRSANLLAGSDVIDVQHLPQDEAAVAAVPAPVVESPSAPNRAGPPTKDELAAVLTQTRGNITRAAKALGTHARQVYRWLEKHGLSAEDFR